jgi:integrase
MPRSRELTWTLGSNGRRGRWRKKYRNKTYYFSGGRGKSDEGAYQAALMEWKKVKGRLDAEAPSPHHQAYQAAIEQWEEALTCARQHGNDEIGDAAIEKLGRLKRLQQRGVHKPPRREDLFENFFELDVRRPKVAALVNELGKLIDEFGYGRSQDDLSEREMLGAVASQASESPQSSLRTMIVPDQTMFQPDALTVESIVWHDRLDVMRRQAVDQEQTVRTQVQKHLELKGTKAAAGELSHGRHRKLSIHLNTFVDWIGGATGVREITSQKLMEYRDDLLRRVNSGEWSSSTASDHLVSLKSFLRWLYRTEAIPALPRIMDAGSHELEISRARSSIETFTKEEISQLLTNASPRTRLYILLTLNTSMTQKDIADLTFDEVDFSKGRINRKRSKTKKFDSTPHVSYKLWPETLALLVHEKNPGLAGRVLVNEKGAPLWSETNDANAGYQKIDNVRSAFDRLRRKVAIKQSFISLKKTAASELASSKEYCSLKGLFLGHAPTTIADKHYAQAPGALLDEALAWLRKQFEIARTLEVPSQESVA